jgi:hypothetical protein
MVPCSITRKFQHIEGGNGAGRCPDRAFHGDGFGIFATGFMRPEGGNSGLDRIGPRLDRVNFSAACLR